MVTPATSSSSRLSGIAKRSVASRTARKTGSESAALADAAPLGQPRIQAAAALLAREALVVGQVVGLAHEGVDGADGVAARFVGSATKA
jgi:hypothetical protein